MKSVYNNTIHRVSVEHNTSTRKVFIQYLLFIIIGTGLLFLVKATMKQQPTILASTALVMLFILLNFTFFKTGKYSLGNVTPFLRYSWYMIPVFILGIAIHLPGLLYYHSAVDLGSLLSLSFLVNTMLTILWEELWFRNVCLTRIKDKKAALLMILFSATLFTALHILNPKLNLITDGPNIFLGGAILTSAFLLFRNFWIPLVFHYSNNLTESLYPEILTANPVLKNMPSLFLAVIFILLVIKIIKS